MHRSSVLTSALVLPLLVLALATPSPVAAQVAFVWETRGGPDLLLSDPSSLAIDPDGNLWVLDGRNTRFQIFAPDGTFLETWGEPGAGNGQFDFAHTLLYDFGAIAFDAAGGFYVVDPGNLRVQKFDAERRFVLAWGGEGQGDGQFLNPHGIAIGPEGRVYITDYDRNDVQVFSPDGALLFKFGGPGAGDELFTQIMLLAVAPDGTVVVADEFGERLQRYTADGTFLAAWGGVGSVPFVPVGVAIDADGRIFVSEGFHQARVFSADGQSLAVWGSEGRGPGQFAFPHSIVLDGAGHVYVADLDLDRVQKFRLPSSLLPAQSATPGPDAAISTGDIYSDERSHALASTAAIASAG